MTRQTYPRQECLVFGCRRTSDYYPPGTSFICGTCYKRAPKALRDRRAKLGRKLGHTRDPLRRFRLEFLRGRLVDRMIAALGPAEGEEMPPALAEELRAVALL